MEGEKVKIYTDGAAKGNPGSAGWGVVFIMGKNVFEIGGSAEHATNNQMELTAPIETLRYFKKHKLSGSIEIISDSKYVILGITEWIFNWQKNNWHNAAKKPVVNRELWEELFNLTQELKPKWTYVKGHNEDKYNDRADEIATSFADDVPVKLRKYKHK
ncbi:MAG: Ribonuclease H [Candidatus Nomurabacteria bacterium GW2011_GWC2_41_8]|uniref:Ribonuclease H n=3 Tax=Candidatus Nomuraibacteriota TaxID=1752729 RepID=A0A1F6YAE3_9BACT|nr:MAG: Ribonuclease H [Candidatus Nomurabacteria bacterium GW2011_GWA2_41_25]KKS24641.1 MAG: Ribonuclease H [Candidatus Nomurabacteria bacterium GW2011_GWC2_41_8]OGI66749.1 MAG: ribonuclease HI [Candidatus Nomurabacteria bacterium RIFCSPHIGHO2_01_FULL_41_91]OGI80941.1 MAG: ribonuclease HI [Candidatus Nomurabacteria bacterium RIFCSPHIGHO2_02_FULL_41_52]OGI84512.1 MAG: ribonuclease HI [Candidatus Nomurabacteria bacterium RIFCSPHIGHO2_12_FULL_42_19]OGI93884.1 MAG: ribonuclease HI [Candidatus Nom